MSTDMTRHAEVLQLLNGIVTDAVVGDVAGRLLQDSAAVIDKWWIDPVAYDFATPTSKGAVRLRGVTDDSRHWSVFVKVIQAFRHWPMIGMLEPDMRQRVLDSPLWRYEADVYTSPVGGLLPDGLRLPVLYAVLDLGDDRVGIVLEDVETVDIVWDDGRFARAARLLAMMSVRVTKADALPPSASRVPGEMSRLFYESRLRIADLPALADDRTWMAHPKLAAGQQSLQGDLVELGRRVPALLDRLEVLPQLMIHGDASPQNLLIPAADTDTFVAIDWSLAGGVAAAGVELAQLLIGLAHAGQLPVAELEWVRDVVIDGYMQGLMEEQFPVDRHQVACGLDGALALHSAFTALPLDRLSEQPSAELDKLIQNRLLLTRYLCDLGLAISLPG